MWRLREYFKHAKLGIQDHLSCGIVERSHESNSLSCHNESPDHAKCRIDDSSDNENQYDSLHLSKTQPLWSRQRRTKLRCCWPPWICAAVIIITVIVSVFVIDAVTRFIHDKEQHGGAGAAVLGIVVQCGTTPAEALAKGCIYEPMMSSWMPSLCYFKEVADSYDDIFETWPWYADPDRQESLTTAEQLSALRSGDYHIAFTKPSGHDLHCLYTWRKLNYAIHYNKTWVDSRTFEAHHSDHCAKKIAQDMEDRDRSTQAPNQTSKDKPTTAWPMLYHSCVPLVP